MKIRNYKNTDIKDCAVCLKESFFSDEYSENELIYLTDYTKALISKSNFTFVAEENSEVTGFICGEYQKSFNKELHKKHIDNSYNKQFIVLTLKYLLNTYKLSPKFKKDFDIFLKKAQHHYNEGIQNCDTELSALASKKSFRKGLGTALVNAFIQKCKKENVKSIKLLTSTIANYKFYDKRGFTQIEKEFYNIKGNTGESYIYEYII